MTTLHASSTSAPLARSSEEPKSWSESAYDWLLRSQQLHARSSVPHDPWTAAWSFVRPSERYGTGVAFMDAALTKSATSGLPVVELRGNHHAGKTWTLITLAARFVADTRLARFRNERQDDTTEELPQVVIFDSNQDALVSHLLCAVRSALLRQMPEDDDNAVEQETNACLSRIHILYSDDLSGWVPMLVSLRSRLMTTASNHPTLILWDGFLSESGETAERMEVIRQLTRLLKDVTVLLVTTTCLPSMRHKQATWEKHVHHRITLEQRVEDSSRRGHDNVATVHNNLVPFTITSGGVLC